MTEKINTVAQELKELDSSNGNQQSLSLMYQAFLESPLADDQQQRIKVIELYKCLQQLL